MKTRNDESVLGISTVRQTEWKQKGEIFVIYYFNLLSKRKRGGAIIPITTDKYLLEFTFLPNGFFSHPALHKKLELLLNNDAHFGQDAIGQFSVQVYKKEKEAAFTGFYPYGDPKQRNDYYWAHLKDLGIATFSRIAIIKDILEHMQPDSEIHLHMASNTINEYLHTKSDPLEDYFRKVGIDPSKKYSLKKYLAKFEKYFAKHQKK